MIMGLSEYPWGETSDETPLYDVPDCLEGVVCVDTTQNLPENVPEKNHKRKISMENICKKWALITIGIHLIVGFSISFYVFVIELLIVEVLGVHWPPSFTEVLIIIVIASIFFLGYFPKYGCLLMLIYPVTWLVGIVTPIFGFILAVVFAPRVIVAFIMYLIPYPTVATIIYLILIVSTIISVIYLLCLDD